MNFLTGLKIVTDIPDKCKDFMKKVYLDLFIVTMLTLASAIFSQLMGWDSFMSSQPILFWSVVIIQFCIILFFKKIPRKLFLVFGILEGFIFSVILSYYSTSEILTAGIQTIIIFGIMSFLGAFSNINFMRIRGMLLLALLGLLVTMVVSYFIPGLNFWISIVALIIFPLLISVETQEIIKDFKDNELEDSSYYAIGLYLSILNIFLHLLNLGNND